MLTVCAYTPDRHAAWDALVRVARNGVFLFERGYMDYHADRFQDASMMCYDGDELVALLPAHRQGSEWVSHGGLTFAGMVLHPRCGAKLVIDLFDALLPDLARRGATRLLYKPLPHLYHRMPSEDDLYALHRLGAQPVRMDLSTSIDLAHRLPLAKGRKHALSKARRARVQVRQSEDFAGFWPLLQAMLAQRHGVSPTHTLDEIRLLASRFAQIRFHGAYADDGRGELLAGCVAYHHDRVLHTQYLAASEAGRDCGALDAVIAHLIDTGSANHRWLSFGASSERQGRVLNEGLAAQKEMFGGRSSILQCLALDFGSSRVSALQEQAHAVHA